LEPKNRKKAFILFILLGGIVFGAIAGAILAITGDFPQIRSLETYRPSAVTRIYSADKKVLAKKAIVATEDRNFYKHSGVDLKGILRAVTKDILAQEFVEGASTITQQLAKTLFLTPQKTLVRKIKEAVLAFQLERRYTKDEILEMYLNQVYFGSGAYGVESAARIFFKDTGVITASACDEALKEPVIAGKQNRKEPGAGYFVEYVKGCLEEVIGSSRLYKGGLTIYTTLSFKFQKAAEDAVANGLIALETRMKSRGTCGQVVFLQWSAAGIFPKALLTGL
jgi:penicillin-binding protein 1A